MSRYHTYGAKTVWELAKLACLEESGDELLQISKFGKSGNLTANTTETVWTVGGHRTVLFNEQTISIVSTSANDTLAGTGAQVVFVQGLDGDYNILQETVNMNGTTAVTLTNKFMRIERMIVVQAGSSYKNAGVITATETSGSTVQAQIEVGRSQTQMACITIPAGYTGLTNMSLISCYRSELNVGARRGEVDVVVTTSNQVQLRLQTIGLSSDGTGSFFGEYQHPFVTPEKTEVHYEFTPETSNTYCSVVFNIVLVKGVYTGNHSYIQ